ncbi:MAG: TraB/GumN family protein [Deltaproteobacteria bacterium]|nr:TraB/GumN family protein [Deltaproteobacteria bacterium]
MTRRARLLVVVAVAASACRPVPASWVVEHEGKRSTLVGTMHAEVDVDALSSEVTDEVVRARVLVTEADVRASAIDADEFLSAITLPDDQTLQQLMDADDWAAVVQATTFMDLNVAARVQPWFLEGQIVVHELPQDIEPIDAGLVALAERDGVPLAFFETWQQQVTALNGLGLDDGLAVLLPTARDPAAAAAAHLEWAEAYRAGDVDRMTALAFDAAAMAERPAYYEQIVDRHQGWLDEVEQQVRAGDAVIAVGFMHLLTERGLPAQLEERGYRVIERSLR